jgi:hypothetical protein
VFYAYAVLLVFSGVLMLVLAALKTGRSMGRRIWSGILGAGFAIYGLYLLLLFQGGTYRIFIYAFILPIVMTVQFFRQRAAVKAMQAANPGGAMPAGYGQSPSGQVPPGYAQPYGQVPPGYAQPYGQVPPGYAQPYGQVPPGYAQPSDQAPYGQVPPAGGPAQPPQG